MAQAFVYASSKQGTNGFFSNATTVSVPLTTTSAAGDLLVLFIVDNGTGIPTVPTGWTSLFKGVGVSGRHISLFYKISNGTETTATFTNSAACSGIAFEVVFRNVNQVTPIAAHIESSAASATSGHVTASLSNTPAQSISVGFFGGVPTSANTGVTGNGFTEYIDFSGTATPFIHAYMAYRGNANAVAGGTTVSMISTSNYVDTNSLITINGTANTAPTLVSAPAVTYPTGTDSINGSTQASVAFTYTDDTDTTLNYQIRTAASAGQIGNGTLVTSGTLTANTPKSVSLTDALPGINQGSLTLYLRVSDNAGLWSSDSSFNLRVDTTAPNDTSSVTVDGTITEAGVYRLVLMLNDPDPGWTRDLTYEIRDASNGGGNLLATGITSVTGSQSGAVTTAFFADVALVAGANTRYVRTIDSAGNAHDTAFIVTPDTFTTYAHEYQIATVGDDAHTRYDTGGTFQNNILFMRAGYTNSTTEWAAVLHFNNILEAQGGVIQAAKLAMTAYGYVANPIDLIIAIEDADNPTMPTTSGDAKARTLAAITVPWTNVYAARAHEELSTPDISILLQQVTNRPGWVPGNAVNIFIIDGGNTPGNSNYRMFDTYDGGGPPTGLIPTLMVNARTTSVYTETGSPMVINEITGTGFAEQYIQGEKGSPQSLTSVQMATIEIGSLKDTSQAESMIVAEVTAGMDTLAFTDAYDVANLLMNQLGFDGWTYLDASNVSILNSQQSGTDTQTIGNVVYTDVAGIQTSVILSSASPEQQNNLETAVAQAMLVSETTGGVDAFIVKPPLIIDEADLGDVTNHTINTTGSVGRQLGSTLFVSNFESGGVTDFDFTQAVGAGNAFSVIPAAAYNGNFGFNSTLADGSAVGNAAQIYKTISPTAGQVVAAHFKFRCNARSATGQTYVAALRGSTGTSYLYFLDQPVSGRMVMQYRTKANTLLTVNITPVPTVGVWHDATLVYDATDPSKTIYSIYIDGVQVATATDITTGTTWNIARVYLGLNIVSTGFTGNYDYDQLEVTQSTVLTDTGNVYTDYGNTLITSTTTANAETVTISPGNITEVSFVHQATSHYLRAELTYTGGVPGTTVQISYKRAVDSTYTNAPVSYINTVTNLAKPMHTDTGLSGYQYDGLRNLVADTAYNIRYVFDDGSTIVKTINTLPEYAFNRNNQIDPNLQIGLWMNHEPATGDIDYSSTTSGIGDSADYFFNDSSHNDYAKRVRQKQPANSPMLAFDQYIMFPEIHCDGTTSGTPVSHRSTLAYDTAHLNSLIALGENAFLHKRNTDGTRGARLLASDNTPASLFLNVSRQDVRDWMYTAWLDRLIDIHSDAVADQLTIFTGTYWDNFYGQFPTAWGPLYEYWSTTLNDNDDALLRTHMYAQADTYQRTGEFMIGNANLPDDETIREEQASHLDGILHESWISGFTSGLGTGISLSEWLNYMTHAANLIDAGKYLTLTYNEDTIPYSNTTPPYVMTTVGRQSMRWMTASYALLGQYSNPNRTAFIRSASPSGNYADFYALLSSTGGVGPEWYYNLGSPVSSRYYQVGTTGTYAFDYTLGKVTVNPDPSTTKSGLAPRTAVFTLIETGSPTIINEVTKSTVELFTGTHANYTETSTPDIHVLVSGGADIYVYNETPGALTLLDANIFANTETYSLYDIVTPTAMVLGTPLSINTQIEQETDPTIVTMINTVVTSTITGVFYPETGSATPLVERTLGQDIFGQFDIQNPVALSMVTGASVGMLVASDTSLAAPLVTQTLADTELYILIEAFGGEVILNTDQTGQDSTSLATIVGYVTSFIYQEEPYEKSTITIRR